MFWILNRALGIMAGLQLQVSDTSCPLFILRASLPFSISKPTPLEDISRIITVISFVFIR